jgi:hypothetical protein
VAAAVASVGCIGPLSENIERQFADAKSARADYRGGWIPDILPDDATSIREVHNLDTNATWGCFRTQNVDAVRAALSKLKATKTQAAIHAGPRELFRDFSWWPNSMRSSSIEGWQFVEPANALESSIVRVGVDTGTGTVCFHRGR